MYLFFYSSFWRVTHYLPNIILYNCIHVYNFFSCHTQEKVSSTLPRDSGEYSSSYFNYLRSSGTSSHHSCSNKILHWMLIVLVTTAAQKIVTSVWLFMPLMWSHFHVRQSCKSQVYRVSQEKRNARFHYFDIRKYSIFWFHQIKHCLLKRMIPRSLIWFGSKYWFYSHFLKHSHLRILFNLRELFTTGIAVHKFSPCFVCTDQWASGQQCIWKSEKP